MASGSPPDLSQLSLSSQSRQLHDPNAGYDYDPNARLHQFATSPPIPAQSQYHHNPLAMNPSPMKTKTMRGALPSQWLDSTIGAETRSMSPNDASDFSSSGGSPQLTHPLAHLQPQQGPIQPSTSPNPTGDDEVIPTAIVIKNIPFNVKRETLLDIIASLSIPTPYAFNYHLDPQGAFRGLAFANFRQAADADAVVVALNGFDVQGRKLRVEYKKVLQAGEKERIEREKALRRMRSMQLEKEQQTQPPPPQAQPQSAAAQYDEFGQSISPAYPAPPQRSYSTSSYHQQQQQQYSPPSVPAIPPLPSVAAFPGPSASPPVVVPADVKNSELDLNDPSTLEIYSRILLFKDDRMRDELAFSRTLSPKQRRVVHLIAQKLGVYHYSVGEGEERYAVVTRIDPNRAQRVPHTLSRAPSAYLNSSQGSLTASAALRSKKSMPDMKTLHTQAPRLTTRASNGNIREGYATIASPSRRSPGGFGALFGNTAGGSNGSSIPPVPTLPSTVTGSLNGGAGVGAGLADSPTSAGVVRQPRGPGVGGFGVRSTRAIGSENAGRGGAGLEARSHEPLEI